MGNSCTCSACELMEMYDRSLFHRFVIFLNNTFGDK